MESSANFINNWDHYLIFGAYTCTAIGILILLYHEFRILLLKDYKEKYDYVNLHEVRYFWYAIVFFIGAFALYMNKLASKMEFGNIETWFYVRIFITASFIVVSYVLFQNLIQIYYPRFVEKKLNRIRNKPRISPTGNAMRKLAEQEEEAHLDADQFNEQNTVQSVDYDVWVDEKTGFKKIEKYIASQHAIECPECGYVTFKIVKEEIEVEPGADSPGVLLKHFKCSYCKHREARESTLAAMRQSEVTA
ncbi:MAG TPA: hypothetical protein VD927_00685 [Chryseosolibacter sp.]|nr:hypothetical protein [Chryseosolibacter sp.]